MSNSFLNFFKEPAPKPLLKDKHEIKKKYKHYQWQIFTSLYMGYVISYMGRKNVSVAMPEIMSFFKVTKVEVGIIISAFTASYAIGKFVNGILADKANVRTFFSSALVLAGFCLFSFAFLSSFSFLSIGLMMALLAFVWGSNAWFHSMTFPPIAKSLTFWFSKKTRGFKWSLVSTSHQVGVMCGSYIAALAVQYINWQSAFYIPGVVSILGGLWLYKTLRDKPVTEGLPTVEEYEAELEVSNGSVAAEQNSKAVEQTKEPEQKLSYLQMLTKYILCNPLVWILSLVFLFVYVVRQASEDWLITFFQEVRGNGKLVANNKFTIYTLVGVGGTIFAGFLSDKLFKGRRTPVNLLFLFGLIASLFAFSKTIAAGANSNEILDFVYAGLVGFFVAGLQNLVGLQIVEFCAKDVASAANGFAGTVSYVGSTLSGICTGYMSHNFGWNGAFSLWIGATAMAILLLCAVFPFEKRAKANNAAKV